MLVATQYISIPSERSSCYQPLDQETCIFFDQRSNFLILHNCLNHNLVIRPESSCFSFWDSHRYKTMSLRSKIMSPRSTFKGACVLKKNRVGTTGKKLYGTNTIFVK